MATLSRADMERVIREGGSVLHGGKIRSKIEHLPSAAELAQGDPAAEARAAETMQAEIDRLQAQLAKLQGAQAPALDDGQAPEPTAGEPSAKPRPKKAPAADLPAADEEA